jgi:hypothetical protein
MPTACGPSPSPIRLIRNSRNALATARMRSGASAWVSANVGPRYIAPKNTGHRASASTTRTSSHR